MASQLTSIKIPSMMGGVSKSSPSKRRPDQVEEANNVYLSAEEGLQKRQATEFMPLADSTLRGFLDLSGYTNGDDAVFYEFRMNKSKAALIVINPDTALDTDVVQIFDASTGNKEPWLDSSNGADSFVAYIRQGTLPSAERYRMVRVKASLFILNTEVEAKFKTTDEGAELDYQSPFRTDDPTVESYSPTYGKGFRPTDPVLLAGGSTASLESMLGRPIGNANTEFADPAPPTDTQTEYYSYRGFDQDQLIYKKSSYLDRKPNTDNGVMVDTQDTIAINYFYELGEAPDAQKALNTVSNYNDGRTQHTHTLLRSPFIRNSDEVRAAMVALHSQGVEEVSWVFEYNDPADTDAEDSTNDSRVGSSLFGSPHLGDGFIFEVRNGISGAPAGYYRTIATPVTPDRKTESTEFQTVTDTGLESYGEILFDEVTGEPLFKDLPIDYFKRIAKNTQARYNEEGGFESAGGNYSPSNYYVASDALNSLPYYQRVRAPELGSVLDRATFPHLIAFNNDPNSPQFVLGQMPLVPRYNGTNVTNPGPSFLAKTESPYNTSSPTGAKITGMGYWRGRLWLASGTTIVSSQAGNQYAFFIDDAEIVSDKDPLDLSISDSNASNVNWIVPFERALFLGTDGSQQFVLTGADNFISPATAALDATSQHSISAAAEPFKVGPYLFFSDAGRLFLYQGKAADGEGRSTDVSSHVLGWFPQNVKQSVSVPEEDIVIFLSDDEGYEDTAYVMRRFTTSTEGDFASSFCKWTFRAPIVSAYSFGSFVYFVLQTADGLKVERMSINSITTEDILLDSRVSVAGSFDPVSGQTEWTVPFDPTGATGVYEPTRQSFAAFTSVAVGDSYVVRTAGDYSGGNTTFGFSYEMLAELSPLVLRDGNNTAVDSSLQIKDLATRHYRSGTYEFGISRRGRYETKATFDPYRTSNPFVTLEGEYYQENGQAQAKVSGPADDIQIQIRTDGFIPVNITNVEARVMAQSNRDTAID